MFISASLRSEYEDVLNRPAIRAKNVQLTDDRMWAVLDWLDQKATLIPNPPKRVHFSRDPGDERILNLAIEVGANYIVTRDRDLLELASEGAFRFAGSDIRIVDPVQFLPENSVLVRELPDI